jgi:hypothetical protein
MECDVVADHGAYYRADGCVAGITIADLMSHHAANDATEYYGCCRAGMLVCMVVFIITSVALIIIVIFTILGVVLVLVSAMLVVISVLVPAVALSVIVA